MKPTKKPPMRRFQHIRDMQATITRLADERDEAAAYGNGRFIAGQRAGADAATANFANQIKDANSRYFIETYMQEVLTLLGRGRARDAVAAIPRELESTGYKSESQISTRTTLSFERDELCRVSVRLPELVFNFAVHRPRGGRR